MRGQGSRRRHRALDQAAQLRRHADRGLQLCASRTAASSTVHAGARRSGAAAAGRHRCRARRGSARSRWCRTARRSSQSGLLFYNTLFDENAASHVALGSAYKFTLTGGEAMTDEEFERGGRQPQRHARRLHDRIGRARRRRRPGRRRRRAADAPRRVGPRWCCYRPMTSVSVRPR